MKPQDYLKKVSKPYETAMQEMKKKYVAVGLVSGKSDSSIIQIGAGPQCSFNIRKRIP